MTTPRIQQNQLTKSNGYLIECDLVLWYKSKNPCVSRVLVC